MQNATFPFTQNTNSHNNVWDFTNTSPFIFLGNIDYTIYDHPDAVWAVVLHWLLAFSNELSPRKDCCLFIRNMSSPCNFTLWLIDRWHQMGIYLYIWPLNAHLSLLLWSCYYSGCSDFFILSKMHWSGKYLYFCDTFLWDCILETVFLTVHLLV